MGTKLPEPLRALIEQMGKLPGLGPKSAMRIVMTLLKWPESETRRLGESISSLRDTLALCSRCGALTTSDPCTICSDAGRDQDVLCVVPEWDSLLALENGGFYNGQYFVLGGLLTPEGNSAAPEIKRLLERLAEGGIKEVVFALGSTLEAENTVSYLKQQIAKAYPDIQLSRLAQGLPLGAEVRYMDRETLRQSLKHRQKL